MSGGLGTFEGTFKGLIYRTFQDTFAGLSNLQIAELCCAFLGADPSTNQR